MFSALWLIPALPFLGFVALSLGSGRLPRTWVALTGAGSVSASALLSLAMAGAWFAAPPPGGTWTQVLWRWMAAGGFGAEVALVLDPLSLVMVLVVTVVGALIHLYSTGFMDGDPGYTRFFAFMNLFVGFMLVLVLADNLLLLFLGWEGVGLCSYLLIGFWYEKPENGQAAGKSFVVTRVGDTALILAVILVASSLGTLGISEAMGKAQAAWAPGSLLPTVTALLLLGGAVGKSAQLPLQTWLPDAMAGPSPVSALIHAATMVTAGVYLIARTHVLFALAPAVLGLVAVVGAATLLLAAASALVQHDIKRVLAYSTMSQIGYMFLALGAGAWVAAIFHFMAHACFKALLFLSAGCVVQAYSGDHDIRKMGGLRKRMPLVFWCFLTGAAALSALPLVTAGFYSKDLILYDVYASPRGGTVLWLAGIVGAALTSVYIFRVVVFVFLGKERGKVAKWPDYRMEAPLVVLALLAVVAGFVNMPESLGGWQPFGNFLSGVLPPVDAAGQTAMSEGLASVLSGVVSVAGILAAVWLFRAAPQVLARIKALPAAQSLGRLWFAGWGFDRLYDTLFVRPYLALARVAAEDVVDLAVDGIARAARFGHEAAARTQTGRVRMYAAGITLGAILAIGLAVLL